MPSQKKPSRPEFLFLDLGSGPTPGWSEVPAFLSLGEFSMLCSSTFHSAAAVSSLWRILEAGVPETYYLSAAAAAGILRPAERRGKDVPAKQRAALEKVVEEREHRQGRQSGSGQAEEETT